MNNKLVMKIFSITISLLTVSCTIFFMISPKKEMSEVENRYLAQIPKFSFSNLFNGTYIAGLEGYINDQFPSRDNFVAIKTSFDILLGKKYHNGVYIGKNNNLLEEFKPSEDTEKIINKINEFKDKLENINIMTMLIPTSIDIYKDTLPNNLDILSQKEYIDYIYSKIKTQNIDVYKELLINKDKYDLYYRLDHHWTIYGAYYGYVAYSKTNNLNYHNIKDYTFTKVTDSFKGTLYSKSHIYNLPPDTIYSVKIASKYKVSYIYDNIITDTMYDEKYLSQKDKYSYFLSSNHPLVIIGNDSVQEKKLLIIKDSFANSMIPYLIEYYSEIHIVDLRFYKSSISEYVKENDIDNVLLLFNVNTLDTTSLISIS
jgi:hypothetical protein